MKAGEYRNHWYVTPADGYERVQRPTRLVEEQEPPFEKVPDPIAALVHDT